MPADQPVHVAESTIPFDDCTTCGERAVDWNPGNRVVQCHACGTVAETVALTRSALFQLLGELALPPFVGHPESSGWDCAPLAEHLARRIEEATAGRWVRLVPQNS